MSSPLARHWSLDPTVTFLNHGAFGACPIAVLEVQHELRARLEHQPVQFMVRELEPRLDAARAAVGAFVGADPDDLAFVTNATTGVNTVLRSLRFEPGDELLTTDHAYAACYNALDYVASSWGARVVTAAVPFPIQGPGEVVDRVLAAVTPRTRLALIDHVTSPTGLIFPVAGLVTALQERGIRVLVDGAHAPGMVPLDLRALGADYYTANCHKWLCAPKGAAFLHVRRDRQAEIHPLVISHGATAKRPGRSRFRLEFDWMGTVDPTAALTVPEALRYVGSLVPDGWPEVMRRNHALALMARQMLCDAFGLAAPSPESMIGSLAAVPLPSGDGTAAGPQYTDPLEQPLWEQHRIEVPVFAWPAAPQRLIRVAAQLYNTPDECARLARVLVELLQPGGPP